MKKDFEKYTDKYFLRTEEILKKDNLNPFVRAQVFVRKGPGTVQGLDEAVDYILQNTNFEENGGSIKALQDGDDYASKETLMVIQAPIQDIVALETTYLGILSAGMTIQNDNTTPQPDAIQHNAKAVVQQAQGKPVSYFGARHWHYKDDEMITDAAMRGGFTSASTDAGASTHHKSGIGTIPHALENIYAWKYGKEHAVVESTKAFDKYMPSDIPRIALIDYNNKEIDDSIRTAQALNGTLSGVRVDTCGENVAQGALKEFDKNALEEMVSTSLDIPQDHQKYWTGTGVTISGVYALRTALDDAGYEDVKIILSSGFADTKKVEAFAYAQQQMGVNLFDSLGVGGLYHSRSATMDIVSVGENEDSMQPMAKTGRRYSPNQRLKEVQSYEVVR